MQKVVNRHVILIIALDEFFDEVPKETLGTRIISYRLYYYQCDRIHILICSKIKITISFTLLASVLSSTPFIGETVTLVIEERNHSRRHFFQLWRSCFSTQLKRDTLLRLYLTIHDAHHSGTHSRIYTYILV